MKILFGCGNRKQEGYVGVDTVQTEATDTVWTPGTPMPWVNSSIDEVHCEAWLHRLAQQHRPSFFNELYRVLKPGAQARIITPHWSNERAYGDPMVQWPPITGWLYFYLQREWRKQNAPHVDCYSCDFDWLLAGSHDPGDDWVAFRSPEVKAVYMSRNINTTTDMIATLTVRPKE